MPDKEEFSRCSCFVGPVVNQLPPIAVGAEGLFLVLCTVARLAGAFG